MGRANLNIQEDEAVALLQEMASASGLEIPAISGRLNQTQPPREANPNSRSNSWQPDLRYRALIERLPVVTFLASLDDTVQELYVSPQIEKLLGFTQEEWLDNPVLWFQQLHPEDREKWVAEFARTCSTGANFRAEYRLFARDGREVWVQGECQLIRNDEGRPLFLQGVAFDITHLKRAAAIEEAKRSAEMANVAKSEFLARMSHEIRTPLNGVVGMIDLLKATELNANQQRYAELARASADALLNVINDILDFSKIEAGKVEIEATEFDLLKMTQDLTELLSPLAQKKKLNLTYSAPADLPRRMIGDPNRIRQVLTNLVGNALKFTSAGQVATHILLQPEPIDAQQITLRFEVRDTGIGIPADRIDRLFKSFSQVDTSITRRFGGTGLGLAICKRLVELMGGQISVTREVGKGTTFWFTLKLAVIADNNTAPRGDDRPESSAASQNNPTHALAGLHLLVAEDNEMNQFVTQETLRRFGCTCEIVPDGAQAVQAVARARYDAVLMDCQMPVMDGLEATRHIRHHEQAAGKSPIPIIALTAEAIQGDREKCVAAGMNGYVSKPINPASVVAEIKQWVSVQKKSAPPAAAKAEGHVPPPGSSAAAPIQLESLLARCLHDPQFARQTLEQFEKRAAENLHDLQQGIAQGDAKLIHHLAHNFKAVAAHVGADKLRALAFEIEQAGARNDLAVIEQQLRSLCEEANRCAQFIPKAMGLLTEAKK